VILNSDYLFRLLVQPARKLEVKDYKTITNSIYLFKS
jgi:hypothetical protein